MSAQQRKIPTGSNQKITQRIVWKNVQSLVRRPYADWRRSAHVLLRITDTGQARAWLSRLIAAPGQAAAAETGHGLIRFAGEVYRTDRFDDPGEQFGPRAGEPLHANIAFTESGLRRLGVRDADLQTFDPAFVEGMAPEPPRPEDLDDMPPQKRKIRQRGSTRRAGILGDLVENHASKWEWGGIGTGPDGSQVGTKGRVLRGEIDILLMLFAEDSSTVEGYLAQLLTGPNGVEDPLARVGLTDHGSHSTRLSEREHFGYRDGLSQPLFPDSNRARKVSDRWREYHQVAAGEFVMGYLNERDEYPESPWVNVGDFGDGDLAPACTTTGKATEGWLDFGQDGTYLVARQLQQNVATFDWMVEQAADLIRGDHQPRATQTVRAAGLLMGRGVNGEPLVPDHGAPMQDGFKQLFHNDYGFHYADKAGTFCPIGSHVRRANPRDSLDPHPDAALSLSKQHRILRRSRIYGARHGDRHFQRHRDAEGKLCLEADGTERGLFFICLNTDIAGQFEFVQDMWVNDPNFGDLEQERDAILAPSIDTRVSLPSKPFTRWMSRISALPRHLRADPDTQEAHEQPAVTVRGGAYFFLPGRQALMALASAGHGTEHTLPKREDPDV